MNTLPELFQERTKIISQIRTIEKEINNMIFETLDKTCHICSEKTNLTCEFGICFFCHTHDHVTWESCTGINMYKKYDIVMVYDNETTKRFGHQIVPICPQCECGRRYIFFESDNVFKCHKCNILIKPAWIN